MKIEIIIEEISKIKKIFLKENKCFKTIKKLFLK